MKRTFFLPENMQGLVLEIPSETPNDPVSIREAKLAALSNYQKNLQAERDDALTKLQIYLAELRRLGDVALAEYKKKADELAAFSDAHFAAIPVLFDECRKAQQNKGGDNDNDNE